MLVVVRGMATLADTGAKIFCTRTPEEDQEDRSESWNAGCNNDDVHLDAASQDIRFQSFNTRKSEQFRARLFLPIPHKELNSLP